MNKTQIKQHILDAYNFRHACKAYDPTKKISDDDMQLILETGRLSPSSFGFEPWKFLLIENKEIRQLIGENAWGVGGKANDASHLMLILARQKSTLNADSPYIRNFMQEVQKLPEDVINMRLNFFRSFSENEAGFADDERYFFDWAGKQCYIALGNMLTTAAMLGIDSTPMEGFHMQDLNAMLVERGLYDPAEYRLCVIAVFGYRLSEPAWAKTRRPIEDVVETVK